MSKGEIILDDDGKPGTGLWDAVTHKLVTAQAGTVTIDPVTGDPYAPMQTTGGGGGGGGLSTNDGTFAKETGGHLATIDTSTATTATNTTTTATNTGNTATNTSNINTAFGVQADAAWSLSGNATLTAIAKKIALELSNSLAVQQTDLTTTGTITAAVSGAGSSVALTLGQGQSSWKMELTAATTFTSGTTLAFEHTVDGANWTATSAKVAGQLLTTPVQTVVGPGPLEISGNAAAITQVRVRCTVLASGDQIAVTIRSGAGIGSVGILSSIPAGSSTIGGVKIVDSAGTNNLAVNASGQIAISNLPSTQTISGTITANAGTNLNTSTLALESGGHLATIDSHIPANGQATMSASVPVVIASNQSAIPISGSITASNASIGADGSAIPTSSTLIGASDGTNLQQLLVESSTNRNLRTGIYSGANEATVTGANALKVDASATTQPISGTVTVNALPTGANTIGNVGLVASSALIGSIELTDSAGTNKASISAAGAIKVDNSANTQPVSGTVTSNAGTGNFNVVGTGTAGTPNSGVVTVQGIASGTAQPVSGTITANVGTTNGLALDASVSGILNTQGATTSGLKGPLVQGAVTTSAPSYTTAQTSPISLTTAGAVRVDASATTQPVSGAISVSNMTSLGQATMANSSPVVIASNQTVIPANITQINSTALAANNPMITETIISNAVRNGQAFTASTGPIVSPASGTLSQSFSIFSPVGQTTKNIYIYSIRLANNIATTISRLYLTTTDPTGAGSWTNVTPLNHKPGGSSSVLSGTNVAYYSSTTAVTVTGSFWDIWLLTAAQASMELLTAGTSILLPASAANGLAFYNTLTSTTATWGFTVRWLEL